MSQSRMSALCLTAAFALMLAYTNLISLPSSAGYDIVIIAGQSNAVGWGGGSFSDSGKSAQIDARIFQIGRYGNHNLQVLPANESLEHHSTYSNAGGISSWVPLDLTQHRVGFGMSFARQYVKSGLLLTGRKILLVPAAAGSTFSYQWERANCVAPYNELAPLYCDMLNRVHAALNQPGENRVVALLWSQGEADVAALYPESAQHPSTPNGAAYTWRIATLFNNLRGDLANQGQFPIVMGGMVPAWNGWGEGAQALAYKQIITQASANVANVVAMTYVADVANLPANFDFGVDLNLVGDPTNMAARVHFSAQAQVTIGQRMFALYQQKIWPEIAKSALLSPLVFEWRSYLALNPNLRQAGITTQAQAEQHWLAYGAGEGRQADGAFAVAQYLASNPSVQNAFAADKRGAIIHYVLYGFAQGWRGWPTQATFGGVIAGAGDGVIGNGVLTIATSDAYAGAITSLNYGAMEFINNFDHGRQLQVAVWNYGMGECNNPNEAGAYSDGPSASSSQLLSLSANAEALKSTVRPAYYIRAGQSRAGHSCGAPATLVNPPAGALVTQDLDIAKTVTLNYKGDPQIFTLDSTIFVHRDVAALPASDGDVAFKVNAGAPALNGNFNKIYRISNAGQLAPATTAWTEQPLIFSSSDGNYAMGMFAPDANSSKAIYGWQYEGGANLAQQTGAASVVFNYPSAANNSAVSQRVIYVVGSLEVVRNKMQGLMNPGGAGW